MAALATTLRGHTWFPLIFRTCCPHVYGRRLVLMKSLTTRFAWKAAVRRKPSRQDIVNVQAKPEGAAPRTKACFALNDDKKTSLAEWGINAKKIKGQVEVRKLSVDKCKTLLFILHDLGLEQTEVGKMINRRPGILLMKEELLLTRLDAIRKAGIQPDALARAVKRAPGVLTAKTEQTLPRKIEFFKDLNVKPKLTTEEILHILTKAPDIIATCSISSMEEKFALLANDLRFNRQQLRNILLKQPSTLTFSVKSLLEKYKYCYSEMNMSPSSIARCPRVFQCSMERIKERHLFLKETGRIEEGMVIDDFGLGAIVTPTDKNFAEKIAKSSLHNLQQFREKLAD